MECNEKEIEKNATPSDNDMTSKNDTTSKNDITSKNETISNSLKIIQEIVPEANKVPTPAADTLQECSAADTLQESSRSPTTVDSNVVSNPNSVQGSNPDTIESVTAVNTDEELQRIEEDMKTEHSEEKSNDKTETSEIDKEADKELEEADTADNESLNTESTEKTETTTKSNESTTKAEAKPKEVNNVKANGHANGTAYKTDKSLNYYKSLSGKIRKFGSSYVFKQENIKSYTDAFGIDYNIGG